MWKWVFLGIVGGTVTGSAAGQTLHGAELSHIVEQTPVAIQKLAPGTFLVDFGQVAFGNLSLLPETGSGSVTVRFGEAIKNGRVDAHPPSSVRYAEVRVSTETHVETVVAPPADARNTKSPAVLTPSAWGVLIPFRWAEVEGWQGELKPDEILRRAAFDSTWVDGAASFHSSDAMLDKVWELCHYSIKATTFAGMFIDGDRERRPYEADAYLNELGYFSSDTDTRIPRATFDYLMRHPTWPTEWGPQMVLMAYADWMQTGDTKWLAAHYESLKGKLLEERVGADGLVVSSPEQMKNGDIVDWPQKERDGYVFTEVNTVVNAFRLQALRRMGELAGALGKEKEAELFAERERKAAAAFQEKLFDPTRGVYRDGEGTDHASLHANLFPLAFGLVPSSERSRVAKWVVDRGMAGSVYAAQYLLEGLFESGEDTAALRMMTAAGDRSWRHMVDAGATITWEAWDQKYKPNQDWNHAWGAAPANLLPRFVLGVRPLSPGWRRAIVEPHPGMLTHAEGLVPTPQGEVSVAWKRQPGFVLQLRLPKTMTAQVKLPVMEGTSEVLVGGKRVKAQQQGAWWVLDEDVTGSPEIEER